MPRTSKSALSVVHLRPNIEVVERVNPPEGSCLNQVEVNEFRRVVNALPADWFSEASVELLVEYCRQVVLLRNISSAINVKMKRTGNFLDKGLQDLLYLQDSKTKLVKQLMTSMRMTQQSLISKTTGKHSKQVDMPWEFDAEED